ncbi:RING1 and YY1-binding protein B [Eucyclogobius newberryi]|uniref:RING1 and YY1-binding protein B n=1 Tax=Eucyclogobius newberryi TaxID=166745 RepID=UPI003B58F19E
MGDKKSPTRPKRQAKQAIDDGYWDCSVCTFRNTAEAFKCSICDVRKGTSTRKPRINSQLVAQQVAQQFPMPPPAKKERRERGEGRFDKERPDGDGERRPELERPEHLRAEGDSTDKECSDKERHDKERHDKERHDKERHDKERHDKERHDKERHDKERHDKERHDKERHDKERHDKERHEKERSEKERSDKERRDKERRDKECRDKERHDKERHDKERHDKERHEKERHEKERHEKERHDKEHPLKEKPDREKEITHAITKKPGSKKIRPKTGHQSPPSDKLSIQSGKSVTKTNKNAHIFRPKLKNIDRSTAQQLAITVGNVTVIITDFKEKTRSSSTSSSTITSSAASEQQHQSSGSESMDKGSSRASTPKGDLSF